MHWRESFRLWHSCSGNFATSAVEREFGLAVVSLTLLPLPLPHSSRRTNTTTMTTRPDEVTDAQEAVSKLLGSTVICTLDDGRSLEGTLVCLDRLKNIILSSVTETRKVSREDYGSYLEGLDPPVIDTNRLNGKEDVVDENGCIVVTRKLSQAFAPGSRLVKVEVTQKTWDRAQAATTKE